MKQIAPRAVLAISSALCAASLSASDRWETPSDNGAYTNNALHHGLVQGPHDLESPDATPDEDWYEIAMQAGHSYEVMVFGGAVWAYLNCPDCGAFDRVDPQGNVLTPGSNEGHDEGAELVVRWIAESEGIAWFRARLGPGYPDPSQNYDITLWETTCFLPRFNNSGSQVTVLVVQNTLNRPTRERSISSTRPEASSTSRRCHSRLAGSRSSTPRRSRPCPERAGAPGSPTWAASAPSRARR